MACQMGCRMAHRPARQQQHSMQSRGRALPGSGGPGRLSQQKGAPSEGSRLQAPKQDRCACTVSSAQPPVLCLLTHDQLCASGCRSIHMLIR